MNVLSSVAHNNLVVVQSVGLLQAPEHMDKPKYSVSAEEKEDWPGIIVGHRSCN